MIRVADGCIRGAAALGRDILVAKKYKDWLEEVGCELHSPPSYSRYFLRAFGLHRRNDY